jgi:hypothetical protein
MNGKIKFHKATGPAFEPGQLWSYDVGRNVEIVKVYGPEGQGHHASDYTVLYRNVTTGEYHQKDAWNFQVRYTHVADRFVR